MLKFGNFLRGKRNQLGLKQAAFAIKARIGRSTLIEIEKADTIEEVDEKWLILLATAMGGDIRDLKEEYLVASEAFEAPQVAEQPMGALPYRSLPSQGILVFNKTPAGVAVDYRDVGPNMHDRLIVAIDSIGDPNAFAVQIVGNSMEPDWREGDFAIIAPSAQVEEFDECFIQFNGENDEKNTFKRVRTLPGGKIELIPNNMRDHKPEIHSWENHVDGSGGNVIRVLKCVALHRPRNWTRRSNDPDVTHRNQRQNEDDLPVIQRER